MIEITMPQAGQTMEEGTVVRWLKAEGQAIKKGEILLEIETDKATIEVESAHSGTVLKILSAEGTTVPVLTPIALLGELGEDVSQWRAKAKVKAKPAQQPAAAGNVTPVLMPQAGQTMEEGTIVKWRVQPGAKIKKGDIILEVETDKAVVEIEAVDEGRVSRIVVGEGQTVSVLTPVAYLADNDADVDAYLATQNATAAKAPSEPPEKVKSQPQAQMAETQSASATGTGRIKASPAARKLAGQRGIDLADIGTGSGPGGRIVLKDIPATAPGDDTVRRPISAMRKAIARTLVSSKQTVPHFYMRSTIDVERLMAFYRGEKSKYRCSLNDVLVLACARVLQEFPAFRSRIDDDQIVEFRRSNIGLAVGMDDGLVVPVIVGADKMNLQQVAAEARRLVESARAGKIEGMGKGVFTVTNLGMYGIDEFTAIINPPESAILAVGAAREAVVVRNNMTGPGRVMTVTLSCDHRVVDGLCAAKFLERLKELLEQPEQLAD